MIGLATKLGKADIKLRHRQNEILHNEDRVIFFQREINLLQARLNHVRTSQSVSRVKIEEERDTYNKLLKSFTEFKQTSKITASVVCNIGDFEDIGLIHKAGHFRHYDGSFTCCAAGPLLCYTANDGGFWNGPAFHEIMYNGNFNMKRKKNVSFNCEAYNDFLSGLLPFPDSVLNMIHDFVPFAHVKEILFVYEGQRASMLPMRIEFGLKLQNEPKTLHMTCNESPHHLKFESYRCRLPLNERQAILLRMLEDGDIDQGRHEYYESSRIQRKRVELAKENKLAGLRRNLRIDCKTPEFKVYTSHDKNYRYYMLQWLKKKVDLCFYMFCANLKGELKGCLKLNNLICNVNK